MDQYHFIGLASAALKHASIRRAVGHAHRRALLEACIAWKQMYLCFSAQSLLSVGSTQRTRRVHAVARLHTGDAFANGSDNSRGIGAGCVGEWWLHRVCASAHVAL